MTTRARQVETALTAEPVVQCDPRDGSRAQRAENDAAIRRVPGGGRYVLGEHADLFERGCAGYLGSDTRSASPMVPTHRHCKRWPCDPAIASQWCPTPRRSRFQASR
jgi:hypothetical protein